MSEGGGYLITDALERIKAALLDLRREHFDHDTRQVLETTCCTAFDERFNSLTRGERVTGRRRGEIPDGTPSARANESTATMD